MAIVYPQFNFFSDSRVSKHEYYFHSFHNTSNNFVSVRTSYDDSKFIQ
jgi:hypothetical protein